MPVRSLAQDRSFFRNPRTPRAHLARIASAAILCAACSTLALAGPADSVEAIGKLLGEASAAITPERPVDGDLADAPGLLRKVHDRAADMAASAMDFIGVHYRRGGQSAATGFDCSGFTRHVFELSGLALPRRADEQAAAKGMVTVRRADLQPGDLVFFNTMRRTFSHVGIYIGENRFIHAPSRGKSVRTDDLDFAYWAKRFTGARRAEPAVALPVQAQDHPGMPIPAADPATPGTP